MDNTKYWFYSSNFIPFADDIFHQLISDIDKYFPERTMFLYGKTVKLKRRSCIVTSTTSMNDKILYNSDDLPFFDWTECSQIERCKQFLNEKLKINFDYCLVHLYPDEKAGIGWHFDKEALKTPIVSISLGETRKFRLRPFSETKSWSNEFELKHGDMFLMKTGCQQNYKHCVPVETSSKKARINLTFRRLE